MTNDNWASPRSKPQILIQLLIRYTTSFVLGETRQTTMPYYKCNYHIRIRAIERLNGSEFPPKLDVTDPSPG